MSFRGGSRGGSRGGFSSGGRGGSGGGRGGFSSRGAARSSRKQFREDADDGIHGLQVDGVVSRRRALQILSLVRIHLPIGTNSG